MILEKRKLFSFLAHDLEILEEYFREFAAGLKGVLKNTVESTLLAGGKRIRPGLFFICAKGKDFNIDYLIPAAASIEIIHTASLIHDDIIDKSLLRRGRKTIHNTYDRDTAKFVGNYLFTQTFVLLNKYNDPRILEEISVAAQNLVRGEFDQIKTKKDLGQGERIYLKKINEKTSSLFKVSCALGGILSNSSEAEIEKMRRFGQYLGISFQINDDLLDMDARKISQNLGKPTGNDIRQGNITLPIIYAVRNRRFKKEIRDLFTREEIKNKDIDRLLTILPETDAIEHARERLKFYLGKAREIAESISSGPKRQGLLKVCSFFEQEAGGR
ncbi:MAG: polyprenyl synthetase family protein [Actinomycetota bacterium]|nr:MAG: polyprenyl synthetase family protein [Actinomycetota bacterium]